MGVRRRAQAKELLFPVYTFMLVAFLKTVVDLGGSGETRQWEVGWSDGCSRFLLSDVLRR